MNYKNVVKVLLDILMMALFYAALSQGTNVSPYVENILIFFFGASAAIGMVLYLLKGEKEIDVVKKLSEDVVLPKPYVHGVLIIELLCLSALGWFWVAGFYLAAHLRINALRDAAAEYKASGKLPNDDSKKSE